jgi:GNAT superfamily N-acetyltransferase
MIQIKEAKSKGELDKFIEFPNALYKNCPQYVPDFKQDVLNMLNPNKNPALKFCQYIVFLAYKDDKLAGRIIGIINPRANTIWHTKYVRFGYIDFIDDLEVSKALVEAVARWGKSLGMTTIQGPMGFTDYDKEGMLIGDYNLKGSMTTIYNYPYYKSHMEALGFQKEADWIQIKIDFPEELPQRFYKVSQLIRKRLGLRVVTLTKKEMYGTRGHDVFHLLNQAYAPLFGFTPFDEEQIDFFLSQYVPMLDTKMMPVVQNERGEIIGVAITLPGLSDAMRKSDGKLFPLGWFYLLRSLKWRREDTMELLLIGVRPDYHGKGVNSLFFEHLLHTCRRYGFKYAETCPQLETNTKEISQWKDLAPHYIKPRRCWCKELL